MKNIVQKINEIKSQARDCNGQPKHSYYGLIYQGPESVKPVITQSSSRRKLRQFKYDHSI